MVWYFPGKDDAKVSENSVINDKTDALYSAIEDCQYIDQCTVRK